jgi:hypothetical protein
MSVGFRTGAIWSEVGSSDFLHAFFSTICYHLESNDWGSKYPYLQKKLYYGELDSNEVKNALDELQEIKTKFSALKPEDIIWDAEDLTQKPPETFYVQTATNLSECFITSGKKNLFNLLYEVLDFSSKRSISVKIQHSNDLIK